MKVSIVFILTLTLLSQFVFAMENYTEHKHEHDHHHAHEESSEPVKGIEGAACAQVAHVKVNGLVCDFCARALEKIFSKRDEVAGIDVDLSKGRVDVAIHKDKKLDDSLLSELITKSGYNVVSINRGC